MKRWLTSQLRTVRHTLAQSIPSTQPTFLGNAFLATAPGALSSFLGIQKDFGDTKELSEKMTASLSPHLSDSTVLSFI